MHNAFTNHVLADIAALDAPYGVVSVYASSDFESRDRVRIEADHALSEVELNRNSSVPPEQLKAALDHARERISEQLIGLPVNAPAIAGFIPVGNVSDAVWLAAPEIESTIAVHAERPFLLPLLRTMELYGTGGVVALSSNHAVVYEWADGRLEELASQEVEIDTTQWPASDGPFNAHAARGKGRPAGSGARSRITTHDAFEAKLESESISELASDVAPVIDVLTATRNWDRIVWFGSHEAVDAVRSALSADLELRHVSGGDQLLVTSHLDELRDRVRSVYEQEWLKSAHSTLHTVGELPPASRVENIEEAVNLAQEGRIDDLYVHAVEQPNIDDESLRINALIGEVVERGGLVHALPPMDRNGKWDDNGNGINNSESTDEPMVLATLRW